ncbi:3-hydroxyisobutyrate dehydrogenase [Thioalkalivibrio sp. HK1]|uniref:3-hydroxyisobutyrate dehydrogenase n=1 Tax=Thioalkalivibrio sp. HK1 TaxID=1469245 RepID=UPI0004721ED5|nr:3-hydroxyisobutyrate dehydrogenase [Thioalkalivibrio sp. HK1]
MSSTIGFIGVGNMGLPMIRNLIKAGHGIKAFDISAEALEAAKEAGATIASAIADAATDTNAVITMLPQGQHVREAYLGTGEGNPGILSAASSTAILIDCSTVDIESAKAVAERAEREKRSMVDAPVSGGISGAAAGTLTFMVGGTKENFERARPILEAMGRNIVHIGGSGLGQAMKICNNMMAGIALTGTAEAVSLGQALGIDPKTLHQVMSTSSGQNWMMDTMYPVEGVVESAASNRGFAPGFRASLMAKDLGLAQAAAQTTGTGTPLGALTASLYRTLCLQGGGELDCSAIYRLLHGDSMKP